MNVRDLHEKLRTHFSCVDGTPRSYMEIRCPINDGQLYVARFVYETVGVTMRGATEDIEPILCSWLWQKLFTAFSKEEMEDHTVLILFRRWPQIAEYTDGDGHEATKITMRLVIPGDNLRRIFGDALKEDGELLFKL